LAPPTGSHSLASSSAPPTPPAASRATASAPMRCPSRSSGSAPSQSCRTSPALALLVVARELEIVALTRPAHDDVADAGPRVKPRAQRPECSVVRRHRAPGEPDRSTQKLAALVEHGLLDGLVRLEDEGLRNREAQRPGGLQVDQQFELRRLLHREIRWLGPFKDPVDVCGCTLKEFGLV